MSKEIASQNVSSGKSCARHWDSDPFVKAAPVVYTYTAQPTDNVDCSKIGQACAEAARNPGGDYIDQGLQLLKDLQSHGYGIVRLPL